MNPEPSFSTPLTRQRSQSTIDQSILEQARQSSLAMCAESGVAHTEAWKAYKSSATRRLSKDSSASADSSSSSSGSGSGGGGRTSPVGASLDDALNSLEDLLDSSDEVGSCDEESTTSAFTDSEEYTDSAGRYLRSPLARKSSSVIECSPQEARQLSQQNIKSRPLAPARSASFSSVNFGVGRENSLDRLCQSIDKLLPIAEVPREPVSASLLMCSRPSCSTAGASVNTQYVVPDNEISDHMRRCLSLAHMSRLKQARGPSSTFVGYPALDARFAVAFAVGLEKRPKSGFLPIMNDLLLTLTKRDATPTHGCWRRHKLAPEISNFKLHRITHVYSVEITRGPVT